MHRSIAIALAGLSLVVVAACSSATASTAPATTEPVTTGPVTTRPATTRPATTAALATTDAPSTSKPGGGTSKPGGGTSAPAVSTSAAATSTAMSGTPQQHVAQLTIEYVTNLGMVADVDCVGALADQLSDADAQALIDTYPDGDPQLSAAGQAIGTQLASCYSGGSTTTEDIFATTTVG